MLSLLLFSTGAAFAQELQAPVDTGHVLTGPQRVAGKVMRPGVDSMVAVPRVLVTLHRVGEDTAAPIDSILAGVDGSYEFRFTRTGDPQAIYFVSAAYGGITYFTPPLVHSTVVGDEAEIAVFDTTSAHVPISTRGHHLIISSASTTASRTITEVFEIANDSSVTRVAREGGPAVWSTPLPPRATQFAVTQGDIPAAAVRFDNGVANVYAPLAPGLKQFAISYSLPASAFPLQFRITRPTQVLEVLIEEEEGTVTGAKLKEVAPVSLERRSFRRFLADDVPANQASVITLPASGRTNVDKAFVIGLTLTVGGAMAVALARTLRQR